MNIHECFSSFFQTEIQKKDLKGVSIIMDDIFKLLKSHYCRAKLSTAFCQ